MKNIRLLSLLALMLSVGCNDTSRDNIEPTAPEKWYFTVGASSRTSLGDADENNRRALYWSEGDRIAINGIVSDPLADIGTASKYATFAFNEQPAAPYNVLYPASIYTDPTTVTLPLKRTITPASFDVPMATFVEESGDVTMHHLCAAIKLPLVKSHETIYSDKYPLKYIKFEGNNKEQVSGRFEIDYTTQTLTSLVPPPAEGYYHESRWSRTFVDFTLTDDVVTIYLVVPANTYENGFTITIYNTAGFGMRCTKPSSVTLSPGEIYSLPTVAYYPTFTEHEAGT